MRDPSDKWHFEKCPIKIVFGVLRLRNTTEFTFILHDLHYIVYLLCMEVHKEGIFQVQELTLENAMKRPPTLLKRKK